MKSTMITFIVADWPASSMQQHRLSGKSDRPQASNITTADNINHRSSISLPIFLPWLHPHWVMLQQKNITRIANLSLLCCTYLLPLMQKAVNLMSLVGQKGVYVDFKCFAQILGSFMLMICIVTCTFFACLSPISPFPHLLLVFPVSPKVWVDVASWDSVSDCETLFKNCKIWRDVRNLVDITKTNNEII